MQLRRCAQSLQLSVVTLTDLTPALFRVKQLGEAYMKSPLHGGHCEHRIQLAPSWAKHEPPVHGVDGWLSRRHVLDLAVAADDVKSCFEVFVYAMAWGYGDNGYGPYRTGRIIEGAGSPHNCGSFVHELKGAAAKGWRSGFEFLKDHSPKYLGPAFGTKLLYFVSPSSDRAPILDSIVAGWLLANGVATETKSIDSRRFDLDQYVCYVKFVDEALVVLSKVTNSSDIADRGFVEYLVFQDHLFSRTLASFSPWLHNLD